MQRNHTFATADTDLPLLSFLLCFQEQLFLVRFVLEKIIKKTFLEAMIYGR